MTKAPRPMAGFSLIELMIVVAIIGILGAIAYPSYQQYVTRSRRVDAAGDLLELSQFMERYFTENGRYDQDGGGNPVALPFTQSPKSGTTAYYNIAFAAGALTATAFRLVATPAGVQATNDTQCAALTLDATAVRCILNGTKCSDSANAPDRDAVAACWK